MKNSTRKRKTVDEGKLKFFIESIAKFCDKCGTPYSTEDLRIIQESEVSSIIHFSCTNCKSRHIATFLRPVGVSSRMPINTDLTVEEIGVFTKKKEIPVDDILEIYTLLSENEKVTI
jgi:hypothetical protein